MRILRKNIKFHPVTLSGGGVFNMTGRKNASRPFAANVSTGWQNQTFLGHQTTFNPTSVLFGSSSPPHLTMAQAVNQTVSGHGPLNAEHMRISQSAEPASYAAASGDLHNAETGFPSMSYCWSFKLTTSTIANALAASIGPGNAFYDKWLVILRDQWPDVPKTDNNGVPAYVYIACQHEPFGDSWGGVNGGTITAAQWAQLNLNLCKIAVAANAGRTNPIKVCGIMNGHDAAFAQFSSYYPTSTLNQAASLAVYNIGVDVYDVYSAAGVYKGLYQMTRGHDFAVSVGYGDAWSVPELGAIIGSNQQFRPTDAQADRIVLDVESTLNTWPAPEQPTFIDWFNSGGQPFDGCDDEGHHTTTGTGNDCTGVPVSSNLQTHLLPLTLDDWARLTNKQSNAGLVPSTTLTPSTTLVPAG